jgi:6-phosphogluconate dehydrogenase
MQIGMIGLGRMGGKMSRQLMKGGHECVVYDHHAENVAALVNEGATGARSLYELVQKLSAPRAIWIVVPSGEPTEETVTALSQLLQPGDVMTTISMLARAAACGAWSGVLAHSRREPRGS